MQKNFAKLGNVILSIFHKEKKKLNLNTKINSLKNYDSLNHLNLIFSIQKKFNIKFSLNEIEKMKTIKDLLKYIEKNES